MGKSRGGLSGPVLRVSSPVADPRDGTIPPERTQVRTRKGTTLSNTVRRVDPVRPIRPEDRQSATSPERRRWSKRNRQPAAGSEKQRSHFLSRNPETPQFSRGFRANQPGFRTIPTIRCCPERIRQRHLPSSRFPGEFLNGSSRAVSAIPLGRLSVFWINLPAGCEVRPGRRIPGDSLSHPCRTRSAGRTQSIRRNWRQPSPGPGRRVVRGTGRRRSGRTVCS